MGRSGAIRCADGSGMNAMPGYRHAWHGAQERIPDAPDTELDPACCRIAAAEYCGAVGSATLTAAAQARATLECEQLRPTRPKLRWLEAVQICLWGAVTDVKSWDCAHRGGADPESAHAKGRHGY